MNHSTLPRDVVVTVGAARLSATLAVPERARGVVLFAHGSGSSRHSPRNRYVARVLQDARFATVLLDLMTPDEERLDAPTGNLRFDVGFLANRLIDATEWVAAQPGIRDLPKGYFGASTGAAAALIAAGRLPHVVRAVVSRGGRPDLAADALRGVRCPTLFIVGGADPQVVRLNQDALRQLSVAAKALHVIPGAGHLFEEPGALEQVSAAARDWFDRHLGRGASESEGIARSAVGAETQGHAP